MVFALWLYVAQILEIDVSHIFFESGHSFSEVDAMHGRIETESKYKELFHPDEWVSLIRGAKKKQTKKNT